MNKTKNLDAQIILSILFIITTIISIILLYNEDIYLKYKKILINPKFGYIITNINKIIIFIILILFIYLNYQQKEQDKSEGNNTHPDNLQIIASILSAISGLIVLYVTLNYYNTNITTSLENPT